MIYCKISGYLFFACVMSRSRSEVAAGRVAVTGSANARFPWEPPPGLAASADQGAYD